MILRLLRSLLCPETEALLKRIKQLELEYAEICRENQRLESRVALLSDALVANFEVPPAEGFTKTVDAKQIYPHNNPTLKLYQTSIADMYYYAFPRTQWVNLLTTLQRIVNSMIGGWVQEISDCDDYALIMSAYVALSFIKAKYTYQGAFMILWSTTHAYNGFIDDGGNIWVYEPQNNQVVGRLGETVAPYDTKKVWMLSQEV